MLLATHIGNSGFAEEDEDARFHAILHKANTAAEMDTP